MKRLALAVLLISILGFAMAGSAKGPVGALSGTVLDAAGNPVSSATVTVQTSDGNHPFATHAGADGHFEFKRLETGEYDMRAQSNGAFSGWLKRVSVHANKTTRVTLHLPAPAQK